MASTAACQIIYMFVIPQQWRMYDFEEHKV